MITILKIIAGLVAYGLTVLAGAIIIMGTHDISRNRYIEFTEYGILISISLLIAAGLSFLVFRSRAARKTGILSFLILGAVSAYIVFFIELLLKEVSVFPLTGLVISLCVMVWAGYLLINADTRGKRQNLLATSLLICILSILALVMEQYFVFETANKYVQKNVSYEEKFYKAGSCVPTLANKDDDMVDSYLNRLNEQISKVNRYFKDEIDNDSIIKKIEVAANNGSLTVVDISINSRLVEFYSEATVLIQLEGKSNDYRKFIDEINSGDMLVSWLKNPVDKTRKSAKKYDDKYNFIFQTYAYLDMPKNNNTYGCTLDVKRPFLWPFTQLLSSSLDEYQAMCMKKWEDHEYVEKIIQSQRKLPYLLGKIAVFTELRKTIPGQRTLGGDFDVPLCPLVKL